MRYYCSWVVEVAAECESDPIDTLIFHNFYSPEYCINLINHNVLGLLPLVMTQEIFLMKYRRYQLIGYMVSLLMVG